jgi:hypothetical protein
MNRKTEGVFVCALIQLLEFFNSFPSGFFVVEQMYHLQISSIALSEYPCSLNSFVKDVGVFILRQALLWTVEVATCKNERWAFSAIAVL